MTKNLTEGNPLRLILAFSLPVLLGNLLQQFYNMADTSIVGLYLGSNALAGVGASSSVQFLVLGFCEGLTTGLTIPVAQRFGANDIDSMKKNIFNGMVLLSSVSVVVTTLCVVFCSQILHLLNTPADIFENAYTYLVTTFSGIPLMILYNYMSGILRAVGDSRTPLVSLVFSTIFNLFLDLVCVMVLGLGVLGAALATVVSQGLCGMFCFIYIHRKVEVLTLHRRNCVLSSRMILNLLALGLPMGLQFSITAIGSMILQTANNSLGSTYISSFTAVTKLKQLFFAPFRALGIAVSTFASQNMGAHKVDRIKKGLLQGTVIGVAFGFCLGFLFWYFGEYFIMLFIHREETDVIMYAKRYLVTLGMFYWVIGILNIWRPSVQSIGYSGKAMFAGFFELAARSLVTFIFVPVYGYSAICFADPTAWIFSVSFIVPVMVRALKRMSSQGC
ncbi:MATE family efflux transporter [Treponema sp.]|uniref:MATE family efflux transporter n=1 Tax=Treponema sp. TaxID=166 RepID=UPI00298DE6A1|nr:MATE family efflux transporter [Treponema sp.]